MSAGLGTARPVDLADVEAAAIERAQRTRWGRRARRLLTGGDVPRASEYAAESERFTGPAFRRLTPHGVATLDGREFAAFDRYQGGSCHDPRD